MSTVRISRPGRRGQTRTAFAGALLVVLASFALQACDFIRPGVEDDRPSRINDARGDFLASFAGPNNPDLDVVSAEVSFDGSDFVFESTSAGSIGMTPGALFVWGVDRGAGTARFGPLAPGVMFDLVVIVQPDGTSRVRDLVTNTVTDLPAANVSFNGAELRARVPAKLLPSQGFAQAQYTANLWPRTGLDSSNQISDFAPDNSNAPVRMMQ